MSRRNNHADVSERVAALKATRLELAAAYNLPETDQRVAQAALLKINQRNWELAVLQGRPVSNGELVAVTDDIVRLLGKPPTDLVVRFVDGHICPKCQANTDAEAAAAPQTAPSAPNVVPLRAAAPAAPAPAPPKRPDTDFAPARDIATGRPRDQFAGMNAAEVAASLNAPSGSGSYSADPTKDTSHWGKW